jgi:N-acylglucosamine 2-epimerase
MKFRDDLVNDILPFWLGDAIDKERGGIFTCLDEEGNIYNNEYEEFFFTDWDCDFQHDF